MTGLYLISIAVILIIFYFAYRKNSIEETPVYHKPVDKSYYKNVKFPSSYVALDVETTGLDVNNDRIIEIALIRVKDNVIDFEYSSFVNPERPIPEMITELTGISDYNMMSAISNSKMVQDVISVSQGLPFIAHNADFDIGFLSNAFKRAGINNYDFHSYDTLILARNAFPGMPNYKLNTLNKALHLSRNEQNHRAKGDALLAHILYRRCVETLCK